MNIFCVRLHQSLRCEIFLRDACISCSSNLLSKIIGKSNSKAAQCEWTRLFELKMARKTDFLPRNFVVSVSVFVSHHDNWRWKKVLVERASEWLVAVGVETLSDLKQVLECLHILYSLFIINVDLIDLCL